MVCRVTGSQKSGIPIMRENMASSIDIIHGNLKVLLKHSFASSLKCLISDCCKTFEINMKHTV